MHFPSMEKYWILGKMVEAMKKSWDFIFLVHIFHAVSKLETLSFVIEKTYASKRLGFQLCEP